MVKANMFFAILSLYSLMAFTPVKAGELYKMRATAYCTDGLTKSGTHVRKGICATGNLEWLGKTAVLYQRLPDGEIGELIGIYEIQDSGCKDYIVDVWMSDLNECQSFADRIYEDGCGGKVWLQVMDAEG